MSDVRLTTSLTPKDVAGVSLRLLVLHRVSIMLMASGPVMLLVGLVPGSGAATTLGSTMVWLLILVPAYGALVSSWTAYRPGAAEVYEPAEWSFASEGLCVSQPGRDARAEWGEFRSWRSVGGCLLLYTTATRYAVIPWRDVPEGRRDDLEALLIEHLGTRRR
jgi:hypothetical protein